MNEERDNQSRQRPPRRRRRGGRPQSPKDAFISRLVMTVGMVLTVGFLVYVLFIAADVFLLFFASCLAAIFLSSLAAFVASKTPLSYKVSVSLVLIVLLTLSAGFFAVSAPVVGDQISRFKESFPQSVEQTYEQVKQYPFFQWLENNFDLQDWMPSKRILLGQTAPVATGMLGGIASFVIMIVLGIYLAFDWKPYVEGFIRLFPKDKRKRAGEIIASVGEKMRWWLIGKFIGMLIIGTLTTVGLKILGIPFAFLLGLIAAMLTFIPNIGPVLSAVPAVLLAFLQSPQQALNVIILYIATQALESWLITPNVEQRTISIPPGLVILSQIVFGLLLGFLGLALATPLFAIVYVLIREIYIKDILHDYDV